MDKIPLPTEDEEQMAFVEWLNLQGIPHWHTNNEMWTTSWRQKSRSKAMGTQSGIPDLFLVFKDQIIGIEMKRQKHGVVSDTQLYWHKILLMGGVPCYVARGCTAAIHVVEDLLKRKLVQKVDAKELATVRRELEEKETEKAIKRLKNAEKIDKAAKKRKKPVEF